MTEQWQELKETIVELRDNDGTGTQQEICKFLANYMDVLEKQIQEPCEDAISRQAVMDEIEFTSFDDYSDYLRIREKIEALLSVKPQEPKIEKVIKMRDATPEERESIEKYVKSISKPTGVDFWALEQEPCKVSEYDKDHIWYKGHQYISLSRFLEVKAEAEQEPFTDAVSRQTVKEQMIKYGFLAPDMTVTEFVEELPPVTPTRPKGH